MIDTHTEVPRFATQQAADVAPPSTLVGVCPLNLVGLSSEGRQGRSDVATAPFAALLVEGERLRVRAQLGEVDVREREALE